MSDLEPVFYSKLILAEKECGDWRPFIDFSLLSAYIV